MKTFSEFSLIIFSYNEANSLSSLIEKSIELLEEIATNYEIVIVNDGSTDNTSIILDKYLKKPRIKVISHQTNLGIGSALKSGYHNAIYKYVCAVPGDGQFDVFELKSLNMFEKNIFYSFYRESNNYALYRNFLSNFNRLFNFYLLKINLKDVNWVKVYHIDQLRKINITLNSSLIESEICAKLSLMNVKATEIPSKYLKRNYGVSKGGSFKTLSSAFLEMFKLWWEIFKFKP